MTDRDKRELTRRQALKGGAAAAYPLYHQDDDGWFSGWFSSSDDSEDHPAVRVLDAGTEYETDELELGDNLSASETDSGVRLDAATGSSSGGAFEDTDGDGVAELQDDHADLQGGDARNVGDLDATSVTDTSRSPNRDTWSGSSITLTVGTDFSTLQECLDAIPLIPYHEVEIDVPSGTDLSTEDVIVTQTHAGRGTTTYGGFEHKITVTGDTTTPSNNPLGSVMISGFQGGFITFRGFEFQNDNPYKNAATTDDSPFAVLHTDSAAIHDCAFAGGTTGVLCYGMSHLDVNTVDFGANALSAYGAFAKHGGFVSMQRDGTNSGNVGGHAYRADAGLIQTVGDDTLSGDAGLIDTDGRGGIILEERKGSTGWNTRYAGEGYDFENLGVNDNQLFIQSTEPSSHSSGDIWIDNT